MLGDPFSLLPALRPALAGLGRTENHLCLCIVCGKAGWVEEASSSSTCPHAFALPSTTPSPPGTQCHSCAAIHRVRTCAELDAGGSEGIEVEQVLEVEPLLLKLSMADAVRLPHLSDTTTCISTEAGAAARELLPAGAIFELLDRGRGQRGNHSVMELPVVDPPVAAHQSV